MPDLLLELFSEEIPARMQPRAANDLERLVNKHLLDEGFMPEGVKAFATPRRLALAAIGLPLKQADKTEERKGPRVGAPEKAIEGFLRGAGLDSVEQCETRSDKKGDYYVAVLDRKGRDTASVISEMVPAIVRDFPWPKAMRWGGASAKDGALRWVRPMHSILCTFDGEVVPFEVDHLKASDQTEGHRFMAPQAIQVRNFDDYVARLRQAKVILDGEERKEVILNEAKTLCAAQGLELVEDPALLTEVAGLAEWPVVMIGRYDEKFLTLPDEVLTASMRGHQKYFSVRDPKTGHLANRFIVVANIEGKDGGAAMRAGYERVLTARLSDGWFLYHQDLKTPLEEHAKKLSQVTFFEGLGTIADKVERVAKVARDIAPSVGASPESAEAAARLAKADLVTGMVNEFPELQGLMGRYYALEQGGDRAIAAAISDHYKPQGQGDETPSEPVTVTLALADKIDTLTSFWSIDKKPTGSSDPFALRRAALGVISLILNNQIRRPLPNDGTDLLDFFHDRLKVFLRDDGYAHDRIDAVLRVQGGKADDDLVRIVNRLKALCDCLDGPAGANLVAGYKRAANILRAEEKKGALPIGQIDSAKLQEPAEKALHDVLQRSAGIVSEFLKGEDFSGAMTALSELREPIDAFFEGVIVNADDSALRQNRLLLLRQFIENVQQTADFSKLDG